MAFVVDRPNRKIQAYLNGVLADSQDISTLGSIDSKLPLDIGAYTNRGCSTSAISDFRIYSHALDGAQVASIAAGAPPSAELALHLPFDGDFRDRSALANQTVPFYAPAFTPGPNGAKAADFSTSSPYDVSGAVDNVGFSDLAFTYTDWTLPFTGYPGGSQSAVWWVSPSAVYLHSHNARVIGNRFEHNWLACALRHARQFVCVEQRLCEHWWRCDQDWTTRGIQPNGAL